MKMLAPKLVPFEKPNAPVVVLDPRVCAGSGGGPDKTLINSPRFLEGTGYEMICAYMHSAKDTQFERLRQKAQAKNVELIDIYDEGATDWRVVPQLLKLCRERNVAIWHGHDYKTNALGLLLKRFHPMHLVTTMHGWVEQTRRTPLYYWVDRCTLRYYEKVLCVSEDLYKTARIAGVPANRCEILENGIDLDDYRRRNSVAAAKTALGFDPQRTLIGACGRLSAEKGFDVLVAALQPLCEKFSELDCVIIGEGNEKENLSRQVAEAGLSQRVKLLGFRNDVRELYEAFDIFALSSHREGLPNVVLEAMATSVPVVATNINGVPKLVQDGQTGYLVPAADSAALGNALTKLITQPALGQTLGQNGRVFVETHYSFARRMQKLKTIYDQLLAKPR
jgi:glycosyltransferase involved in cell wall biosynthesis